MQKYLIASLLCFVLALVFALPIFGGEKEELQKDLQLIQVTIEKNLYQNEFLKSQGQTLQQKLQAIEKAEQEKVKEKK